jgi:hypothetical protein
MTAADAFDTAIVVALAIIAMLAVVGAVTLLKAACSKL